MAVYIVDASVVIERIVRGAFTENAKTMFRGALNGDKFVVPEFCLMECTNVLWKHVRFQGLSETDAQFALTDLRSLPLERAAVKRELGKALRIGLTHKLAIYDSMYIALAAKSRYPLVTIDMPQLRAANAEGIMVKPITDFT